MLRLKKGQPKSDEFIEFSLLVFGYVVVDDFLSANDNLFCRLKSNHLNSISLNKISKNNDYAGGICKTNLNLLAHTEINKKSDSTIDKLNNINELKELVRLPLIDETAKRFFHGENFNIDVFQTLDTPSSRHIAQEPHFDRIPTLKFMLYINDISSENGAFELSPSTHHWIKRTFPLPRPSYDNPEYFKKTRELPKPIIDNLKPIEGKAGTLIIFHTDTIHNQGVVNNGECRIIRSHFRNKKQKFNQTQNIQKLKNLFKFFQNKKY